MKAPDKRQSILFFEDAIGFTDNYKPLLMTMLSKARITDVTHRINHYSIYKRMDKKHLLVWQGNRKSPGFNPDVRVQAKVREFFESVISRSRPDIIVCMDVAMFFLFNPNWDQATPDKLRGSVYEYVHSDGIVYPVLCTLPLSAYYSKVSTKDIAKLNEGFTDKADYEEFRKDDRSEDDEDSEEGEEKELKDEESQMEWHEPLLINMGNIMIMFDIAKLARILHRKLADEYARSNQS